MITTTKPTEMTNNKQQTTMKLYTEEQVRQMLIKISNSAPLNIDYLINEITPIELPSDEEIKKIMELDGMELDGMEFDEFDAYDVFYLGGAIWMRNKIQGGEQ